MGKSRLLWKIDTISTTTCSVVCGFRVTRHWGYTVKPHFHSARSAPWYLQHDGDDKPYVLWGWHYAAGFRWFPCPSGLTNARSVDHNNQIQFRRNHLADFLALWVRLAKRQQNIYRLATFNECMNEWMNEWMNVYFRNELIALKHTFTHKHKTFK